jgi:bisanhydrobacterioruberin hydratase
MRTFYLRLIHPERFSITILAILHLVGLIGLVSPLRDLFILLTPFNLLVSAALILVTHHHWSPAFIRFLIICISGGILVEMAGVHTGIIFGNYTYGPALGLQLWGVPLMIGINWMIVMYCTLSMTDHLNAPRWVRSLAAAALAVFLDFFIEPAAITHDFWYWENGLIPIQNYLGWFLTAWGLSWVFHGLKLSVKNPVAVGLFLIQWVFFVALGWFSH